MSDDNALTKAETSGAPVVSQILALASQNVNPEMFDRLVAWNEREQEAAAMERFNNAMSAAQNEIDPVARTTANSQTKSFYAKLEDVDHAIRPIYLRHGFNIAYNTVPPLVPGNIRVECEVSLGRHSKKYYREAPADTLGPQGRAVKTVLHGGGSTETYLKRYAVCGAFNVVFRGMDDDGNRGGTKFITDEQAEELRDLCKQAGRIEGQLLDRLFSGTIHSFEEMEAGSYVVVKNTIEGILAQRQRQGQT